MKFIKMFITYINESVLNPTQVGLNLVKELKTTKASEWHYLPCYAFAYKYT